MNIIERAVAGEFDGKPIDELLEAIDDEIDKWHSPEHDDDDSKLHEFLGMSWEEYKFFVEKPTYFMSSLVCRGKSTGSL